MENTVAAPAERIHVTQSCSTRRCVQYAKSLFAADSTAQSVQLHATGRAISKMVIIAEIVKEQCGSGDGAVQFEQNTRIWRETDKSAAEISLRRR